MKKADYKFHKDVQRQIKSDSRENEKRSFWWDVSNPIFIPKRKKFKK